MPIATIDYQKLKEAAEDVEKSDASGIEAMKSEIAKSKEEIKKYKDDLDRVSEIMVVGVCVLLVMVGTLVWTAFTDWRHSGEDALKELHNDRYQFQQDEIEYLEKITTSSAKQTEEKISPTQLSSPIPRKY